MAIQMGRRAIDFVRYHVNLKPNTKPSQSSTMGGGYTMYSREKYPTSSTRRNLVNVDDIELYDTDYKYFLVKK